MPRNEQRRKTQRAQVDLRDQRPADLQVTRRYFQAGGYDKNVRTARALEKAFGIGSQFAAEEMTRRNQEGSQQALVERGAGASVRDEENKQAGYMRAWDQLDAEYDFHAIKAELPEMLRGFNAEEQPEGAVQQFMSEYFQGQFGGLEQLTDSAYAEYLAPKLLELETEVLTKHRQAQIEKIQQEQRQKIYGNAKSRLEDARAADPAAPMDYQMIFADSGTFLDGDMKKTAFWETIYDLAYEYGDPSIIENVPDSLTSTAGQSLPTGISDPKMLSIHQAQIDRATSKAVANMKKADAELDAAQKEEYRQVMLEASIAAIRGDDTSQFTTALIVNKYGKGSDITSLESARRSALDELDSRSWNPTQVAGFWSEIYTGNLTVDQVRQLHEAGVLGRGPQSTNLAEDMMRAADQATTRRENDSDGEFGRWNTQLGLDFPKTGDGQLGTIDPKLGPINADAHRLYNEMINEGVKPREAYMKVREQLDPVVDRVAPGVGERKSQGTMSASLGTSYTTAQVDALLSGKMAPAEFIGERGMDEVLIQLGNLNLSDDKLDELALKLQ